MEEIILKAKMGPPVSKLVHHHIVVTKELSSASLVETRKMRRINRKQIMNTTAAKRELIEAVRIAKKQTKREGKKTLKRIVDGIHINANKNLAPAIKADTLEKIHVLIEEIMGESVTADNEYTTTLRAGKIVALMRTLEVIKK